MSENTTINPAGRHLFLKRVAGLVLFHPLVSKFIATVYRNRIPHRGSRIEIPASSDGSLAASLFWRSYESAEIRFVRTYLNTTVDVVELGSSIGGVSCEIAKNLSKGRKLVCVEANPSVIPLLKRNLLFNAPKAEVRIVHGAICYEAKDAVDFCVDDNFLCSHVSTGHQSSQKVPAVSLGDLLEREEILSYSCVCDIEGAEAQLFALDAEAFRNCCSLVIELHQATFNNELYTPKAIISLIEAKTSLRLSAQYGNVCVFEIKNNK
jgi:FkbM family methyltransferase